MRELFKFFLFALAVAVGFSMMVDNFTRSAERVDVRVFSPSAVAEGDTAVAIVGNRNEVNLSQENRPNETRPDNFILEAFRIFLGTLVVGAFLLTILLLVIGRSDYEKSPY
jgi:hypothetical protein